MPKKSTEEDLGAKIARLRDVDGKTWSEISDIIGERQGKCMFYYEQHAAAHNPKMRIGGRNEEELRKNIAKARSDGLSWGIISARSGKSEGYAKKAFEEYSGEVARGHRIGKGGRFPDEENHVPAAKVAKKAAAKAAKKGVVKKATKKAAAKKVAKKVAKKSQADVAKAVKKVAKKRTAA